MGLDAHNPWARLGVHKGWWATHLPCSKEVGVELGAHLPCKEVGRTAHCQLVTCWEVWLWLGMTALPSTLLPNKCSLMREYSAVQVPPFAKQLTWFYVALPIEPSTNLTLACCKVKMLSYLYTHHNAHVIVRNEYGQCRSASTPANKTTS